MKPHLSLHELSRKAQDAFDRLDRRLGGIPLLLKHTLDSYNAHDGNFVSAAIAYFFFFSLFPLVLILLATASQVLHSEQARQATIVVISRALPVSGDAVAVAIDQLLAQTGAVSILAALSLIYSASGLFGLLLAVANRPWASVGARHSLLNRVLAIALVLGFIAGFFIFILGTAAIAPAGTEIARALGLTSAQWNTAYTILSSLLSLTVTSGLLLLVYWKLPAVRVRFADAWPAALAAGVAWELARTFFAWYFSASAQFSVVYGPFASVIGLLVWLNLTGNIILQGAELSAQIATRRGRGPGHRG